MKINIEYLEQLRAAYNENPREFADRIGVSHQTYYNWLKSNGYAKQFDTISVIGKRLKLKDARVLIIE